MSPDRCSACGTALAGDGVCPECRLPGRGEPRRAPAGSGAELPDRGATGRWDAVVFGAITLILVVVVVSWLV